MFRNAGSVVSACLTMPTALPMFLDPTISIHNANLVIQISPELAPCANLAMIRMEMESPAKNNIIVCPELAKYDQI